jgi:hypothetical protein
MRRKTMLIDTAALTAAANATATQYSVVFVNNSDQTGSACIFQQDPDIGIPDVMSLAWFAQIAAPTTRVSFQWSIQYNFVWSETGQLVPGVVFTASQTWNADLSGNNKVSFVNNNGAYTFQNQTTGPSQGNLYITEGGTIPQHQASVGVGMSGFGTFVVQAEPNMNLIFTPKPEYWIIFGNYIQGQVMDISETTAAGQIQFPTNIYSMTATLNADNTWTIQPTSTTNAQFLKARRRYPELVWGQDPEALEAGDTKTGTLKSNDSTSWDKNKYSTLEVEWADAHNPGTGKVSVKLGESAMSYAVPNNVDVENKSGKLTNNTTKTISYTLS